MTLLWAGVHVDQGNSLVTQAEGELELPTGVLQLLDESPLPVLEHQIVGILHGGSELGSALPSQAGRTVPCDPQVLSKLSLQLVVQQHGVVPASPRVSDQYVVSRPRRLAPGRPPTASE